MTFAFGCCSQMPCGVRTRVAHATTFLLSCGILVEATSDSPVRWRGWHDSYKTTIIAAVQKAKSCQRWDGSLLKCFCILGIESRAQIQCSRCRSPTPRSELPILWKCELSNQRRCCEQASRSGYVGLFELIWLPCFAAWTARIGCISPSFDRGLARRGSPHQFSG